MPRRISRRQLLAALGGGAAVLLARPRPRAQQRPPNLLFIMSDQHNYRVMGCAGDKLAITPNLDRLAARGVRFHTAYTQAPVCVPARMSLITGRYTHAHGALDNAYALPPDERTIGHHFAEHGYLTAAIGKMHFIDPDNHHGFDVRIDHKEFNATIPQEARVWHARSGDNTWRRTTGGFSPLPKEQFFECFVAQETVRFLQQQRDQPFCLWCSFVAPHPPFYPPKEFFDLFPIDRVHLPKQAPPDAPPLIPLLARKQQEWRGLTEEQVRTMIAAYYGMVTMMDESVGTVYRALEGLGLADNTIVSYTSDHGDLLYQHRMFLKFNFFEGSARIPMILSWPGHLPQRRVVNTIVEHVDMYPTFCELAGLPIPETVQGRSLLPLLKGRGADWPNRAFGEQGRDMRMIRHGRCKLNFYDGQPLELYDLENDPAEFYNLVGKPKLQPVVERLKQETADWLAATPPDRAETAQPLKAGRRQRLQAD